MLVLQGAAPIRDNTLTVVRDGQGAFSPGNWARMEAAIKHMFTQQGRMSEATSAASCFVITDLSGKIVMASQAWYKHWKLSPAE